MYIDKLYYPSSLFYLLVSNFYAYILYFAFPKSDPKYF